MTIVDSAGTSEEQSLQAFGVFQPSSGKTRLTHNNNYELFIPPGRGQVVESEITKFWKGKK